MLDTKYLQLQKKVSQALCELSHETLESGQLVDPADIVEVESFLTNAKQVLKDNPHLLSADALREEVKQLSNVDEWYYSYKTEKGLNYDELQDYYNIIIKTLA